MQIPGLYGLKVSWLINRSVKAYLEDNMLTYAAALAYQVLFSIFPFIVFLVELLGFLHVGDFFDWLLLQARLVFPGQAMAEVEQVIGEIRDQGQGGLLSFSIAVAIWVASAGIRATIHALNIAYDVAESRPAWKLYPLSILYTLALALLLVTAAGFALVGPRFMEWLASYVGLDRIFITAWAWLRIPVAIFLLIVSLAVVYYVAPNVEQPFRFVTPGSVVAITVWVAASVAFTYYVSNFADYNAIYGSLGAVIVLLFFFYISSAALLFGAEVNAAVAKHTGEATSKHA